MLKLAKDEGVELTKDQLEAVSGGFCADFGCPKCECHTTTIRKAAAIITWYALIAATNGLKKPAS